MSSAPETPPATPVVRLRGVSKQYGSTTAVSNFDLDVHAAEVLALLGPNGAGKTTTVEMCEGFVRPDAGTIEVLGLNPITDNARLRARIGVMLQGGGGYPAARAGEMLNLVAAYAADPLDPQWLLDTLGLTDAARTTYRRLSGGQQQRLALACALVGRPELVFLDEPTAGMDAHARLLVWELIDALRRDGVTVVLTTHQLKEAEETRRPAGHHRPRRDGGRGHTDRADARRRQRPVAVHRAAAAGPVPAGRRAARRTTQATEVTPGEYLVEGPVDPQVLATVTAWCAQIDVLATDMRVEQRSLEDVFLDLTGRKLRQ